MIELVPYVAIVLGAILTLRLRHGPDLSVAIVFVPWIALNIEIGISIKVAEAMMIMVFLKYAAFGRILPSKYPGLTLLIIYFTLAILAGIFTIEYGPIVPEFAEGGAMRNGYGRMLTQLAKWAIMLAFIVLITGNADRLNPFMLFRHYVISCVLLALLGVLQLGVFEMTGIDLFPVGLFEGEEKWYQGVVQQAGETRLRISSMGGEPKGLGMSLVIAVSLTMIIGREMGFGTVQRRLLAVLFFGVILFTLSTSAFISLAAILACALIFLRWPNPFKRGAIACIMIGMILSVAAVYYSLAARTDISAPGEQKHVDSFGDLLKARTVQRLKLDDSDGIMMASYVADPAGLLLGRGLGLAHYYTVDFIPRHRMHYLWGAIIPAKSGIMELIGGAGLAGAVIFVMSQALLVPVAQGSANAQAKRTICHLQALAFGFFIAFILRLYAAQIILISFALFHVIGLQYALFARSNRISITGHRSEAADYFPSALWAGTGR